MRCHLEAVEEIRNFIQLVEESENSRFNYMEIFTAQFKAKINI